MRKTTNKAFTLVELIVVITILAILGTIGFMSIKGYTSEANNAKISSDLTTIQRGLETKVAEGGSLMAFVTG
jgi:prepilin-type N-terminal cleavage/methylation domain-containing protein